MFNVGMHQLITRKTFTGDTRRVGKETNELDDLEDVNDSAPAGSFASAHSVTVPPQVNETASVHNVNDLDSNKITAGSFANAHDFNIYGPTMIETQNIYNHPKNDPPLSPLHTTIPCTSRNFVGQEMYLKQLREYFASDNSTERKIFLLYGMGGIGKTQISLKFIDDMADNFVNIFWIDSTSEDTVVKALKDAYKEISPLGTLATSFSTKAALYGISKLTLNWLIIYDNADGSPELVEKYIPPGNKGNIIITSRNPAHRRLTLPQASMEVSEMSNESSIDLLLKASGLDLQSKGNREIAQLIVNELNHHPLALDMAGAYIMQSQCHMKDFLGIYNKYRPRILNNANFQGASTYSKTVYKTWELSFDSIIRMTGDSKNKNKADVAKYAMTLVNISAFLHHDNISYEMFELAAKHYNENKYEKDDIPTYLTIIDKSILNMDENGDWDEYLFYESISLLLSFSLIKKTMNSKFFSIHPLVHAYCQDRLPSEDKLMWALNANALIVSSVSEKSTAKYVYQETLLPHLLKNLSIKQNLNVKYYDDLHNTSAKILHNTGMYNIEESYRMDIVCVHLGENVKTNNDIASTLEKMETIYLTGDDSVITFNMRLALDSVEYLGICCCEQGKWTEAEKLQIRVLHIYEKIYDKEHPDTLTAMNNLARTYRKQGKWAYAEELYIKVLHVWERIVGKEHFYTLTTMDNLGVTYQDQGKWTDAEQLHIKVLAIRERIFGEEHPETLQAMSNLAMAYHNKGKSTDAVELQMKLVGIRERLLGKQHPDTLIAMNNLALTYIDQGKWTDAEDMLTKVLSMWERILGKEHPDTLIAMNNLAITYQNQGKFTEAEELQVKVLNMREGIIGMEHPQTLTSMSNLALTYEYLEKWTDAEELQIKVLNMEERILGKEHPNTLITMNNLGVTYRKQGKWGNAEELQVKMLDMCEKIYGQEHPHTLTAMNNLSLTYQSQKKLADAEEMQVKLISIQERVLGKEHPSTLTTLSNLGSTYYYQGKLTDAEELATKFLAVQERLYGREHPNTITAMNNLEMIYIKQGKLTEAEQLQMLALNLT